MPARIALLPCAITPHAHHVYAVFTIMVGVMFTVCAVVGGVLAFVLWCPVYRPLRLESQWLETVWTAIPTGLIVAMAFPSTYVLMEGKGLRWPFCTQIIIGHQWYWEFEIKPPYESAPEGCSLVSPVPCFGVDSYGLTGDPAPGEARLVTTDAHLLMPCRVPVRLAVTSGDVIHNWNIKQLAFSTDGVPGRLGGDTVITKVTGVFHGWCSENCGAGHFSMPCSLEIISLEDYLLFFWGYPQE